MKCGVMLVLWLASSVCGIAAGQTPVPGEPRMQAESMPVVHDPSTVIQFKGRYYVYTTGRGIPMLSSPDRIHWTRLGSVFPRIPERVHQAVPQNDGLDVWAPDIVRVGSTFYLYYAVSSWGSFRSVVALATNSTLDPAALGYRWVDQGVVVGSTGVEDMNDIDPGVLIAPGGRMWLCFGSYHGSIQVVELDPKTGLVLAGATPVAVARNSEAADIVVHDGFFYLFVNHGSCCQGARSEYNIRVGRAHSATGPYLDRHGVDLSAGGGSLFLAAHDHRVGPGHFGRVLPEVQTPGLEQFSLHYEADLANAGRPTLGIRPLLWSADGWPVAGDNLEQGTYQIVSEISGDTLQDRSMKPGDPAMLHLGRYLALKDQQWSIEPARDGCYKIADAATHLALAAGPQEESPLSVTAFDQTNLTLRDKALWSLEQFTDGSYRIRNKASGQNLSRNAQGGIELTSSSTGEDQRWVITTP